jgi:hypothetical protein
MHWDINTNFCAILMAACLIILGHTELKVYARLAFMLKILEHHFHLIQRLQKLRRMLDHCVDPTDQRMLLNRRHCFDF